MKLKTPLSEGNVRGLKVGDRVELSGTIVTARDTVHKFLVEGGKPPISLNVLYHCGPIVKDGKVLAAGPTTSIREEPYEADIIARFGVRAVIGKGGMGAKTLLALKENGCVYLAAVGGAGALMAKRIRKVEAVHMLGEFGPTEAFWVFEVEDMPLFVSMDSYGESAYERVESESAKNLRRLLHSV